MPSRGPRYSVLSGRLRVGTDNGTPRRAWTPFGSAGAAGAAALLLVIAVFGDAEAQARGRPAPADLILTGGAVYTADAARPQAEAVAVRGDRIVFVGSAREALLLRGSRTRVVELNGRAVIPGMIDAHGHLAGLGEALRTVDLVGARSYEEVVGRVAERAASEPAGRWIRGRGWDQNEWPVTEFPTHDALSRAVPDHPVVLTRVDGHALLANARAMEIAGITAETPDPSGGVIVRDRVSGQATGVFVDRAMDLIRASVPAENRAEVREGVRLAMRELNRVGLTGIHDAGVERDAIELFEEMARNGEFTVRNYVMVRGGDETVDHYLRMGPRENVDGNHFLSVRAIKLSADGALGSRGAALLQPYSDDPENRGLVLADGERVRNLAERALRGGFQLNVHAIGDGANRTVLDAFEAALREVPVTDHRFRIEHAQILHRHDIPRFAELGVIPSMQAIHQASDMYWAEDRLGWTRIQGAYAWRSLLDTGVVIAGGSDFPVEPADPMLSFHAAVTRRDTDGWPAGGWLPEQRMTRGEALRHLTIWPAYASFQESLVGSITPGKLADIVVLSRDIMRVPESQIPGTQAEMTIVGGRVVHELPPSARPTAAR